MVESLIDNIKNDKKTITLYVAFLGQTHLLLIRNAANILVC